MRRLATAMSAFAALLMAMTTAGLGDTPDMLDVAADKPAYGRGETARVRIEAPYAGLATVMVLTDRVHAVQTLRVPQGASTVEVPTDPAWGPGAYAAVTLLRGRAEAGTDPGRISPPPEAARRSAWYMGPKSRFMATTMRTKTSARMG